MCGSYFIVIEFNKKQNRISFETSYLKINAKINTALMYKISIYNRRIRKDVRKKNK